ncbi:P22AR C-terminal domain-containing protein [Rodentibacter caecimuris]|uniref:P22AR C-terminal domain-containing protein n=1 Tax=Rodentibacter caecimuris TaxID=1796644 RepID=UPI002248D00A|nr:P22AR C-terminal domain-containing protein [Rodentibacter heylii]MCX2960304.1 BRO family protein [Rodentibacter heylii]
MRVISVNNEPWFVAKDICNTLDIKNPTQALANLDEDERAMFNIGLDQRENFDNRVSEINIVSESGMYTLILRCRDAVKKGSIPHRFRKWVTAEVLPQIRKTGKYQLEPKQLSLPEPEKRFTFEFTEYELEQLVWLWCGHRQMNTLLGDMIDPLDAIGSRFTGIVISHHHEYQRQYKATLSTIQRLIMPFKQSDRLNWTRAINLIKQ